MLHGDLKLGNLILRDDGLITAVDFEFARPYPPHYGREEVTLILDCILSHAGDAARRYRVRERLRLRASRAVDPAEKKRVEVLRRFHGFDKAKGEMLSARLRQWGLCVVE